MSLDYGLGRAICETCGEDFQAGWQLYHHQRRGDSACNISGDLEGDSEEEDGQQEEDDVVGYQSSEEDVCCSVDGEGSSGDDVSDAEVLDLHQCLDNCDCRDVDDVDLNGHNLMKYMSWGVCEITPTGREILRFMACIMKGKSMSLNKQQDLLRYPPPPPTLPSCLFVMAPSFRPPSPPQPLVAYSL
jgi:hypothetical protein